jgi:DNA-binding XRE family transcriptional regulator
MAVTAGVALCQDYDTASAPSAAVRLESGRPAGRGWRSSAGASTIQMRLIHHLASGLGPDPAGCATFWRGADRMAKRSSIGTELRRARERAGLSQHEVAARTEGVLSPTALSRIERGERYPTLRTLEALSEALGVRIVVEGGRARVEGT